MPGWADPGLCWTASLCESVHSGAVRDPISKRGSREWLRRTPAVGLWLPFSRVHKHTCPTHKCAHIHNTIIQGEKYWEVIYRKLSVGELIKAS